MTAAPASGWDCHAHLFGPYDRFPLAPERNYTPPEAVEQQYIDLLARLGLGHGVLVHPSAYGADHTLVFAALAARPQLRGVLVARAGALPTLQGLHGRGIRGLRFSQRGAAGNFAGSAGFDDLRQMAPEMADAGLHAELWTDCKTLPSLADAIRALPVPVVIDHMAMFDVAAGIDEPGFAVLRGLLREGRVWVKLCAYRNLLALPDRAAWEAGRAFQAALLSDNPEQLVWGSDWPHLNVSQPTDAAVLLQLCRDWCGSVVLERQVLADNPRRLYD